MAKIPGAAQISGPASMRPSGNIAVADTTAIAEGAQALASGLSQFASGVGTAGQIYRQREIVSDTAKADALWTKGTLDAVNRFWEDGDYKTFDARAESETAKLKSDAAALIRDPEAQQQWLDATELKRLGVVDSIKDRGRSLEHEDNRVSFDSALGDSSVLISDPSIPSNVRDKARRDISAHIEAAKVTGMISPSEAAQLRDKHLRGADEQLSLNLAQLDILQRPGFFSSNAGISSAMNGTDIATASTAALGGKPLVLDPNVARVVGAQMGDAALPDDPKLAAAYLTDPEVNARYAEAAMKLLTDKYKGDMTAAAIATGPEGSMSLADQWVKSNHDESVLPPKMRAYYRDVMARMAPEAEMSDIPIRAAPGVDLESVDVVVLDRFEKLQSVFGAQLPVISGTRDAEHNAAVGGAKGSQHLGGEALDIDVSSLSEKDRVRFIENASALGFTGVGVYKNSIHLDIGNRRAWGPDYHSGSVPGWAKEVIDRHTRGDIATITPAMKGVAPEYAALSFDQRLKLYDADKQAVAQQSMDKRAGIQVAVDNAPAAIMQSGSFDRPLPTAEDFVAAWGATEGIDKFKQFDASVDVAEKAFGMRTMSSADIGALVEAATPTSTGDMAAVEGKKFDTLSAAARSVLDARMKDPVDYVISTFPSVGQAWKDVGDDPVKFQQALSMTATAEDKLGIENPQLLPKAMAENAANTFKDANLSEDERIGAITHLVMATKDDAQQELIYNQIAKAGGGALGITEGAMAALARGDQAAASYLFRAALVDPDKLPRRDSNIKDAQITETINDRLFDENQIGDVIYGLSDGRSDNYIRQAADTALFTNAVKLRLSDGSASNLDDAIAKTQRDMFGDVKVVTGKPNGGAGVRLVLPSSEDPAPLMSGFSSLLGTVGDAVLANLTPTLVNAAKGTSEAAILQQARDMRVSDILDDGYFVASGDRFAFIDATTGQAIPDPAGNGDLTFSRDDVIQAGIAAQAAMPGIPGLGRFVTNPQTFGTVLMN